MKLSKKIIAFLITIATLIAACPIAGSAADEDYVNVALDATVTASGFTYGMSPEAVIDDQEISGWSSETANNTWLMLDLGKRMKINRIEWVPRINLDQPHTRNFFYIECSNSSDFGKCERVADIGAEGVPDKTTLKVNVDGTYRYVRYRKYSGDYSFFTELRVFVHKDDLAGEEDESGLSGKSGILKKIGVNVSSISDKVTRGEAATAFAQLLQVQPSAEFYKDIKDETVKTAANALCGMGILSENNGKFEPDKEITYEQALKIAVCGLGNSIKAENTGGFPTGYIICAKDMKLLKGVKSADFNKESFINLLYNMLDAKVYETSNISSNSVSFKESDETFLEKKYDIKKTEGILNENHIFTMFMEKTVTGENVYLIDGEKYYSKSDYGNLFAKRVICYYTDDTDTKHVTYMYADEEQSMMTILLKNFKRISASSLVYETEEKDKTLKLSGNCKILKNGKLTGAAQVSPLLKDGMIELYDQNGDEEYDFVKITETKTRQVKTVKRIGTDITIYFTDGSQYTADEDIKSYVKYANGDIGEFGDIKTDDIVSICEANTDIFEAYVGSENIEGKLSSYTTDEVVINWKDVYELSAGLENLGEGYVNNYGTLYLDYFGKAFWFDNNIDDRQRYAIWTKIGRTDGMAGGAEMKFFTDTGSFTIYKIKAPITIDGTRYTSTESAIEKLESILALYKGNYSGIPVRYKSNSYLEITEIETEDGTTLAKLDDAETTTGEYFCQGVWDEKYIVDEDAVAFEIPDDETKEEDYSVTSVTDWGELRKTTLSGYGKEDQNIVMPKFDVVVVPAIKPGYDEDRKTFIIDKYEKTYADEEEVYNLSGWYMGAYTTYRLHKDFSYLAPNFSKGDVIQIALRGNVIANMMYIYNNGGKRLDGELDKNDRPYLQIGTGDSYTDADSIFNEPLYAFVGAYAQEDNYVRFAKVNSVRNGGVDGFNFIIDASKATIYVCDSANNKIKQGSVNDIITYQDNPDGFSQMYVKIFRGRPREIVIYN